MKVMLQLWVAMMTGEINLNQELTANKERINLILIKMEAMNQILNSWNIKISLLQPQLTKSLLNNLYVAQCQKRIWELENKAQQNQQIQLKIKILENEKEVKHLMSVKAAIRYIVHYLRNHPTNFKISDQSLVPENQVRKEIRILYQEGQVAVEMKMFQQTHQMYHQIKVEYEE